MRFIMIFKCVITLGVIIIFVYVSSMRTRDLISFAAEFKMSSGDNIIYHK